MYGLIDCQNLVSNTQVNPFASQKKKTKQKQQITGVGQMPAQKCVVDSCVHQMVAILYRVRKLHTAYLLGHSELAESCPHLKLRTASWGPHATRRHGIPVV